VAAATKTTTKKKKKAAELAVSPHTVHQNSTTQGMSTHLLLYVNIMQL